jgi:hypothetical protein
LCSIELQIRADGSLTVIRKGPAVFKLLAGEDQPLLVRRNAFLVLDLALDVVDSVGALDFEGNRL